MHSKGEGLFDNLMRWIEQFLTLMREGLGQAISLEFLLPHTGQERLEIMQEVDSVARYHYMLKMAYEDKVRRRFGRAQGQSEADAEDEAAAVMVNDVVKDLSFGDLVSGDADDLAAQDSDGDEDSDSDSDEDSDDDDDDDSDSDESGSSEGSGSGSGTESSGDGSSTEGAVTRRTTPTPSIARSNTIGHSPVSVRTTLQHSSSSSVSASSSYRTSGVKHSLDIPPASRPPPPPMRNSRSMSLSHASSSTDKPLPQPPYSARPSEGGGRHPAVASKAPLPAKPTKKKRKKPEGPKPPELHHLPKLLPLFVEMVRPLYSCISLSSGINGVMTHPFSSTSSCSSAQMRPLLVQPPRQPSLT